MPEKRLVSEPELAGLAKHYRLAAKKKRAQAARDFGVSQTSVFHAEESPHLGLHKLRMRMIEAYSPYKLKGPLYLFTLRKTDGKLTG